MTSNTFLSPRMDLPLSFFFIIITLLFLHVPTSVVAIDEQYENCRTPFRCGDINISYPFWGGDRSEHCGYPGFKVECNSDVPEITIRDRTYRVLEINRTARRVTVAIQDYWYNDCPTNPVNSTLDFNHFNYASDTLSITLSYSCSSVFTIQPTLPLYRFYCSGETNTNAVNYFYTDNGFLSVYSAYFGTCKNVQVAVRQSTFESLVRNPASGNLSQSLRFGFGLQWYANDTFCDTCERSNGLCGHDIDNSEFTCHCPDRPEPLITCLSSQSPQPPQPSQPGGEDHVTTNYC